MIKKALLFLFILATTAGCIEADKFTEDGTYTKETKVTAEAVALSSDDTSFGFGWKEGESIDLYYSPLSRWSHLKLDGISSEKESSGYFTSTLEWKNNIRSHVFYALRSAAGSDTVTEEMDPSSLSLSLPNTQYYSEGIEKYMISCGTGIVRGEEEVKIPLEPSLAVVQLNIAVENDITIKTLKLSTVGAGEGKGISGAYTMDITDNSVNLRKTKDNSVTINFGEEGLKMKVGQNYKVHTVMLPARLEGLKLSVSGSTTVSSLEISAYDAMDLKPGEIQVVNLHLVPGPIRQDYGFDASCGSMGNSTAISADILGFQGAKKTSTTPIKGLEIAKSEVELEYIGGRTETLDAYWEITCPEWIVPSKTSGKGAASIELTMLPNMKAISKSSNGGVTDLSTGETANTYIINRPGSYRFDASMMGNGNAGIINGANFVDYNGNKISSANITGGITARVVWQYYTNMIVDVKLVGSQIEFTTGNTLFPGNAIIALYDGAGRVVWSWQIWSSEELGSDDELTNANTNAVGIAAGKNKFLMMDRNLGALAKSYGDLNSHPKSREGEITVIQYTDETLTIPTGHSFTHKIYQVGSGSDSYYQALSVGGILYQWGRKDPILIPYVTSTRPSLLRFDNENNEIERISLLEGGWNKGNNATIAAGIEHPEAYFKPNGTVNWLNAHNDHLWGNLGGNVVNSTDGSRPIGTKTIYDPCPKGYMLPTIDAWSNFSTAYTIGTWASRGGYSFKANSSDARGMFYPGSGSINSSGVLTSYGADTYYWSNTITAGSNNTHQLFIKSGTVNNNNNLGRGNGNHVRCMKQR